MTPAQHAKHRIISDRRDRAHAPAADRGRAVASTKDSIPSCEKGPVGRLRWTLNELLHGFTKPR